MINRNHSWTVIFGKALNCTRIKLSVEEEAQSSKWFLRQIILGKNAFYLPYAQDDSVNYWKVAFFLSNSESRWSLLEGLKWLSNFASLNEIPKIIIDYCQADLAAINMAFTSLETRFCHWHMFKAMQSQTNENIRSLSTENFQMTKRSAITDFNMLVCSRTVKDFGDVCTNYQVRYGRFTE